MNGIGCVPLSFSRLKVVDLAKSQNLTQILEDTPLYEVIFSWRSWRIYLKTCFSRFHKRSAIKQQFIKHIKHILKDLEVKIPVCHFRPAASQKYHGVVKIVLWKSGSRSVDHCNQYPIK
jgi:hypothetical protein